MSTENKPPPQLPRGTSSIWQGISENFAFHSSPEAFIAKRVSQWQREDPEAFDERTVVRARILNRNVAVVSSYRHIMEVLRDDRGEDEPRCVAGAAYHDLMGQFFPAPNLLLADGREHASMRAYWNTKMAGSRTRCRERVRLIVDDFLAQSPLNVQIDLYEHMKTLAWRVLLGCFLDLRPGDTAFAEVQRLQEDLLRGQFSLMPVSINAGFWRSPRTRGIAARKALQALITERLVSDRQTGAQSSFDMSGRDDVSHIANHVLMMTSSLAAKGLASLATAYILNLFLFDVDGKPLYRRVANMQDSERRTSHLRSVYMETERLSPPIVGVMRRVKKDIVLEGLNGDRDILLPSGWDAWLYFVGATRDKAAFGEDNDTFNPARYLDSGTQSPMGFGFGSKTCLGQGLMREINISLAEQMLSKHMSVRGEISKPGLKGWLGWAATSPESWAADIKQLPTQHPVDPVMIELTHFS